LDASGNVLGSTVYGGDGYFYQPECNFAIATKDGGYLLAGYLWQKNAWVVKTDAEGNMQWNQTYGIKHSSITSAVETQNGGYLLLSISNLTDVCLILTDSEGNLLWKTTFPDVRLPVGLEASFNSIISAKDGSYIVVGSKNQSVWLAKLNPQGKSIVPNLELVVGLELAVAVAVTLLFTAKKRKTDKAKALNAEAKQNL
jgi:hypothetical protein